VGDTTWVDLRFAIFLPKIEKIGKKKLQRHCDVYVLIRGKRRTKNALWEAFLRRYLKQAYMARDLIRVLFTF